MGKAKYSVRIERTQNHRIDECESVFGRRIRPGHNKRMADKTITVHKAIGPITGCDCTVCLQYRKKQKVGKYHEGEYCRCLVCLGKRAKNREKIKLARERKKARKALDPKKKRNRREYLKKYHLRKKKAPTKQG